MRTSRQATLSTRSLRKAAGRFMAGVGKHFATLAIALVAILISVATWQHYVTAPWTRNGSVRVQVANVAPQIAGKIVELRVADNQFVHKGDVLYVIDPFDFDVAVRIGKALVDQRAADLEVKRPSSTGAGVCPTSRRRQRSSRSSPAMPRRRRPPTRRPLTSLHRRN